MDDGWLILDEQLRDLVGGRRNRYVLNGGYARDWVARRVRFQSFDEVDGLKLTAVGQRAKDGYEPRSGPSDARTVIR